MNEFAILIIIIATIIKMFHHNLHQQPQLQQPQPQQQQTQQQQQQHQQQQQSQQPHQHHHQHHNQQQQNAPQNQRTHVIMSPEDAATGRKPDIWQGLDIVGSVRNLSPALWNMTHLSSLYLNDNCLVRLPPDIGRLTQLRHLDLSSNKLRVLPRELGELILLEELLLNDNQLRSLPLEIGKLFHLKKLGLKGNPSLNPDLLAIYQEPKGTQKLITYLLEHLAAQNPAPRPQQRPWIVVDTPVDRTKPSCMFTTMCYNVLCDKYATRSLYGYCPAWALAWNYRKHSILEELKAYSADIIALQEVETEQYHDYFLRELQAEGYEGLFSPKSRAKTMSETDKKHVDGCAILYKTSKFSLIKEHLIEFSQLAMANAEGSDDMLNRVMTKDNIALVALLQIKEGAFDSFQPGGSSSGSGGGPGTIGLSSSASNSGGGNGTSGVVGGHGGVGSNIVGSSVSSTNNTSSINVSTLPLHQQRLLVCTAHIHWDPEFCDVKLVQTIMLTHELQAIANQAGKDLLASSGENINSIKLDYLKNGTSNLGNQNHIGSSRTSTNINNFDDHDDTMSGGGGGGSDDPRSDNLGADLIPLILCGDFNSLPTSSVVEFLSNGGISADHQDFKELTYKDCLRKICNSRSSALANSQHSQQNQCNQYSQSGNSSSSASSTDDQQKSNDSLTNTSNGIGSQRPTNKNGPNYNSSNSSTNISESNIYTHPFSIATAYTGDDAMPYTNYT